MATSGSYDFSVNRNEILDLAGEIAGVKGIGRVLSAEDTNTGSKLLGLIVKQWMGKSDFAPGLKVWTRKRAFLFPELNEHEYTLGPGGDHATETYYQTTLDANEAIGQTVLSVASTTNMTAADNIGIRCNDGSIHWSTISSFVAGDTVAVDDALTVAADSGATVYWYTSKIMLPLEFMSVRRMDTRSNETPLHKMTLDEYENIGNKTNDGNPSRYLYERGLTTGKLFFDLEISDTTEIYLLTFLRPVEDFDAATNDPDYPQEWFRPLVGQTAIDWATATGRPVTEEMIMYRNESLAIAQNVTPENEVIFFEPEK